MALKDIWENKVDGVDDVLAEDINSIAEAVIELEEKPDVVVDNLMNGNSTNPVQNNIIVGFVNNKVKQTLGSANDYTDTKIQELNASKVDTVAGKGLSTNDYTTEEKNKLSSLSNYDDTELRTAILNAIEVYQYNTKSEFPISGKLSVLYIATDENLLYRWENDYIPISSNLTVEIGDNGNWYINGQDTNKPSRGERGYSGLVPKVIETSTSGSVTVNANECKEFENALTGETTISLGDGVDGYDNEWTFTIKQGETAQTLVLPEIEWDRGYAPSFGANTVTEVRLWYSCGTLKGVWL